MAAAEAVDTQRRYLVLGPVEAHLDGRVLPVAQGKQTLLLAALLARPDQVVSVDALIDALWGERSPPGAAGTLRALICKLRRALSGGDAAGDPEAEDLVVSVAGGYRLRVSTRGGAGGAEHPLDAWDFAFLLAQARAARLSGETVMAVDAYCSALALWRGAAFAGATGEHDVGALVTREARRLDTERVVAIEERLAAELDLGRHAQLLGELEAVSSADPLRERPSELLMLALHRSGRKHEALAVYRRLRAQLAAELGVEPSAEMQLLHQRLLRQDPAFPLTALRVPPELMGTSTVRPTTTGTSSGSRSVGASAGVTEPGDRDSDLVLPGNLPVSLGGLIGRDETIARTVETLRVSRVVTLTGTAGVGKTSLAVEVAREALRAAHEEEGRAPRFPDGAWLVELAPVSCGGSVVDGVSSALAVEQRQGATALQRLLEHLRPRRLMLVIDNCEHVIDAAAAAVGAVVRGCPHIVVLATSREPLGVDGEQVCPVPPLAVPAPSSVDAGSVRLASAAALFLARAGAAAPGFTLSNSNAAAVGEICRRLDGLPLAIELAATRMRSLSPAEVVDRLEQRFPLLHSGHRTAAMRHRTLHAAIDWSYGLLGEDERRVFDRLSVFAGGFGLEAAERVAADTEPSTGGSSRPRNEAFGDTAVAALLAGLVDKSMIVAEPDDGSTRYRLLETLRAYGREQLAARGEEYAIRRSHAAYLATFVESAAGRLKEPGSRHFADAITLDLGDLRAGHSWALTHDLDLAERLVAPLFRYVEHRLPPEVPIWAERTVEATEKATATQPPMLSSVYAIAARGAARRGDLDRAKVLAHRGVTCADPHDPARRHPLYALGVIALFEGRLNDAGRITTEVEELSLLADDPWLAVRALTTRSLAHVYAGDLTAALAVADTARTLADRSGDPAAIGWSRYATGEALLEAHPDRAAIHLEEALDAARAMDDRYLTGVAMVSATSVRARHGDARQAASLFCDVIDHWHATGNWTQQWTTIRNVVELLVRTGSDEAAAVLLGALGASDTAAPAFGTGAARLAAARVALADHLGSDTLAAVTDRGAAMGDQQTLRFARSILHRIAQPA